MTIKDDLEAAEKVLFDPNAPIVHTLRALRIVQGILEECGIDPQTGNKNELRRRIIRAKGVLDARESLKNFEKGGVT